MATLQRRGKRNLYYLYWFENGKVKGKCLGTSNPDVAKREKARKEYDLLQLKHQPKSPDLSFQGYVEKYMEYAKANKKPASVNRDRFTIKTFIAICNPKMLKDITPQMVEQYKTSRVNSNHKPSGINREMTTIKAMMSKAVEWGMLEASPAKGVKSLKEMPSKLVYLSKEQINTMLHETSGVWRVMAFIAVYTGFRLSEVLHLDWSDVDFKRNLIHITGKSTWTPKDNDLRTVPLHRKLRLFLWLSRKDSGRVIAYSVGGQPVSGTASAYFRKIFKRLKFEGITFHDLRHTFASQLVMAGVDIYTVARLLGHSSVDTTQRYSHLSPTHLSNSVSKLTF